MEKSNQQQKDFFFKLKELCSYIDEDLFDTLTEHEKKIIYNMRSTAFSIKCTGFELNKREQEFLCKELKRIMLKGHKEFLPGRPPVSYHDFYYCFFVLAFVVDNKENSLPDKKTIRDFVAIDKNQLWRDFNNEMDQLVFHLSYLFSDLRQVLTQILFDPETPGGKLDPRLIPSFTFKFHTPKRKKIQLTNNSAGTGIQVSFIRIRNLGALNICELSLQELGVRSNFPELRLPVYISEYALSKLDERGKIFYDVPMHRVLIEALIDPVIIRSSAGDILIETTFLGHKIGYFLLTITDGVVLIRSFLFLTNGTTPEGERLAVLANPQKGDENYLKINTLAALIKSDIFQHRKARALFNKAGCSSLVRLYDMIHTASLTSYTEEGLSMSVSLLEYISN